jgi:hypothetical protein
LGAHFNVPDVIISKVCVFSFCTRPFDFTPKFLNKVGEIAVIRRNSGQVLGVLERARQIFRIAAKANERSLERSKKSMSRF